MSTDLATMPGQQLARKPMSDVLDVVNHLGQLWDLAEILVKSRMLPSSIGSTEAAVAIILKGRELGLAPMAAFAGITVIQGKPVVSPQLMLSLINRSGLLEDLRIDDDGQACRVTMKRRGREAHTTAFSMADAKDMQLAGKDNWKKMAPIMRQWRAVAGCSRVVFPDVIDGMYTPEEMGAEVNEDGEILDPATPPPGQKFPDQGGPGRSGSYASEDHDAAFKKMVIEAGGKLQESWINAWASANNGEFPGALPEMPCRSSEVILELYHTAVIGGLLKPVETTRDENSGQVVPKASIEQLRKMVAILYGKDPVGVQRAAGRFMEKRAMAVAFDFVQANPHFNLPDDFNPEFNILDDGPAPEDESQEVPEPLPPAPKKMGKKELAEQVRQRIEAEKAAKGAADRGDAYEEPEPALANPAPESPVETPAYSEDGKTPRNGRALFAWTKEMEQRHQVGLLKYANSWAKLQDYTGRMVDWSEEEVALAFRELSRKLQSIAGGQSEPYEEALAN